MTSQRGGEPARSLRRPHQFIADGVEVGDGDAERQDARHERRGAPVVRGRGERGGNVWSRLESSGVVPGLAIVDARGRSGSFREGGYYISPATLRGGSLRVSRGAPFAVHRDNITSAFADPDGRNSG